MNRILIFILFFPVLLPAQQKLKFSYSFDQCALTELSQQTNPATTSKAPVCVCGLENDALELNNQILTLPLQADTFFYGDFSLGFSIAIQPGIGNFDVLSKMKSCNADTSFMIVYQSKDSTFVCSLQQGFDKFIQLVGKADAGQCWQQIVLTRSAGQFRLFINGALKDEQSSNFILRLNNNVPISFNGSPCNFAAKMNGLLDNVYLTNYSLNSSQVLNAQILQDQILTSDSLIFAGSSFNIRAESECASTIQWTPSNGLSSSSILNPLASPLQTTKYFLNVRHGFCTATDSVLIKVIDTSKIDCSQLRLPTAFSPNNDQVNDVFFISNNYIIETLHYFDIIDRNGSLMVRYQDPKSQWDGSWNGKELTPGTYYYRISYSCKNEDYKVKGSFFLLK
ncbi:MAG: gliding motility-associated C-terminal domain-containing protein [Saprospiraceae bacterium]|nr:gliding motility-associated C-terminal domain-containing protein [Saprospiraceae bacterium]MBK7736618.1 gliding motility-associated C-terminal domain-containing protein [Saprospiraceae bacterium]MBK7912018.1 gliding motility-associated C-terminal domain-containing protein [Saprospiraceae bacterium]